MSEGTDYDMLRSFQRDELINDLGDIILKYVKDPDDAQAELDKFDRGLDDGGFKKGFDSMSNLVIANLLRDDEYKEWEKKFKNVMQEGSCGYGPDGVPGDTPGETRGMPADKRTMGMMREVIKKEIKKLHEAK